MYNWSDYYREMVSRNIGVITEEEQEKLRNSCVAIAGCGCMGALPADLLCRFGVGRLKIADHDSFEISNVNRQFLARYSTIKKNKAEVLGEWLKDINPEVDLLVLPERITKENVTDFLSGVQYVIDAIDFYNFEDALALHQAAREKRLFVSMAVAIGFGANVFTFDPNGISFEDYIGYSPESYSGHESEFIIPPEKYCPILPSYADLKIIGSIQTEKIPIPSIGIAQALGSSMLVEEIVLFLIGRKIPTVVPEFLSLDLVEIRFRTTK
jgi:molybdopterin/thiamine biosynthesis adenylyltransferase